MRRDEEPWASPQMLQPQLWPAGAAHLQRPGDELAAGLLHELRQPLAALTNYLEAARQMLGQADSRPAELVTLAAEQAWWAAALIGSIGRSIADEPLHKDLHRTKDVLEEAVRLARASEPDRGISLVLIIEPAARWITADRVSVQQVLVNLLRNAWEAMEQAERPGSIRIEAVPGEEGLEVRVSDTGPGIAPSMLHRLFDPFTSSKPGAGRGMGLAISRRIAQAHGGRIEAENQAGGGACFRLILPATGWAGTRGK